MTERDPRLEALKQELKPLAKKVNQRLLRLERKEGYSATHGYQAVKRATGQERPRFNLGGKTVEQLLADKQKMLNFLEYKNSTISGVNKELKRMARQIGVPSDNPQQLMQHAGQFYRLSNVMQDYIRNSSQTRHLSSDEVFMGINRAVEAGDVNLGAIDFSNFNLGMEEMEAIIRRASGEQRPLDLREQLDNVPSRPGRRAPNFSIDDI